MPRKHVLVLTSDLVGPRLAGQAMRMWEISRVLSRYADLVLMAAYVTPVEPAGFRVVAYSPEQLSTWGQWADVLVLSEGTFRVYPRVARLGRPLAIDLVCPSLVESLELTRQWEPPNPWQQSLDRQLRLPDRLEPLSRGDFFFCGSARQRDFYLGLLASLGRLNPFTYNDDLELRRLIEVIPFGLPAEPPQHTRTVLRGVVSGIGPQDFILLWAGGVWAWFDPWTLLEAMARLRDSLPQVKLYFLGVTPPHPQLNWFSFNDRLFSRAGELEVLDRNVFINTTWVDYQERANYLLEADVAVTTQASHLETHLAVRTRTLDYIWAGLPLVTTAGDALGALAEQKGFGLSVPPGDVTALTAAIERLYRDEPLRRQMRARASVEAHQWTWETLCQPLVGFCVEPRFAADRPFRLKYSRKPRWLLHTRHKLGVLRQQGIKQFLQSFESLLPLRRIRVAFRDQGMRAGFGAVWQEIWNR